MKDQPFEDLKEVPIAKLPKVIFQKMSKKITASNISSKSIADKNNETRQTCQLSLVSDEMLTG